MKNWLLGFSVAYRSFRKLTGSDRLNAVFAHDYIRPELSDRILDIGCGPCDVLQYLDGCAYVGLDSNPRYINFAREKFGSRGTFVEHDGTSSLSSYGEFNKVVALGVLHHLNDSQVETLFNNCKQVLKPGGYFISYDPCFHPNQNLLAVLVHQLDRGQFVRSFDCLKKLAAKAFGGVEVEIRTDLCTIPSSVAILRCQVKP